MVLNEIFAKIYIELSNEINSQFIDLINKNDIRVENFFLVNILRILENLKQENNIASYTAQYHIKDSSDRNHIDLILKDVYSTKHYIELKHFSISKEKTNRNLNFYTNNGKEGKKVGIINDIHKLTKIKKKGILPEMKNLVCCAVVTPKPTMDEINKMMNRLKDFDETKDWSIRFPISFDNQQNPIALFYLERSFKN